MVDFSVEPHRIPTLLGAVVMVATAAWIFALSPGSRVHRAFALFFALRGTMGLLLVSDSSVLSMENRVLGYVAIALPFAAVHLANQAWVGRGAASPTSWLRSPWNSWAILAAVAALEVVYFLDHDLWVRIDGPIPIQGPLSYSLDVLYPAYGLIALGFARSYGRVVGAPGARRGPLFALSLGFALPAANACMFYLLLTMRAWDEITALSQFVFIASNVGGLVLVLATVATWFVRAAELGIGARGDALRYGSVVALALATGGLTYLANGTRYLVWSLAGWGALWHLALLGILAYAIVKHRFLGLDVRVRWGVSRGVVASAAMAFFFIISEGLATYLGRIVGAFGGILLVGSLILVLATPLRKLGDRVAAAAMPEAVPVEKRPHRERVALYEEQTRIAWEDGRLTAKERRMLDSARARLGLTEAEAARLERRVLEAFSPSSRAELSAGAKPRRS